MTILSSDYLFKIGKFEVTRTILIMAILVLILLIALIAYRYNHRKQTRASIYMDDECKTYNKKGLRRFLSRKAKSLKNPALICIEIKNLQYIYTHYGKGTNLMYNITNKILQGLGKKEIVARVEFNKFIVVLDGKNKEELKNFCNQIDERLDTMRIEGYGNYNFYLYFGIYENVPLRDKLDVVTLAIAIIPYSPSSDGSIYYYTEDVRITVDRLNKMNLDKEAAYEQKRFVPYIQPKVDLKTGTVVGGEILVRWVDENQQFLYRPDEFIPLFENNGFIQKIDDLMLESACQLAQTLVQRGHPDIVISVNVSKIKFMTTDFAKSLMDIVSQYKISPKNIEFEITETTVMENFQYVSNCIMSIRTMGFNVAMDDFGKEFSSLGSLSSNPFDTIKLDMIFFKNKLATEKDRVIVKNLLDMLSKLNYHKVCEGVSDKATLDVLATINQDVIIQGYCISKPIPISQFEAFANTKFDFNYPPIEEAIVVNSSKDQISVNQGNGQSGQSGSTNITISGFGNKPDSQVDEMRRQMEEMRLQFQASLEEQRRLAHESEMKRMREQMEMMQKMGQQQNQSTDDSELRELRKEIYDLKRKRDDGNTYDYRDDEIARLRRELEDERYRSRLGYHDIREYRYYDDKHHDGNYEDLKRQIEDLKEQQRNQQQIDVNELIVRLSQTQNENTRLQTKQAYDEAKDLRGKLEQERKEKEELEALLREMEDDFDEPSDMSLEAQEKEEQLADENVNLDIDSLGSEEEIDDADDDADEEEADTKPEKLEKPNLTREELEAIIKSYQDKYLDQWNKHAKEELKDGYYEVIDGLKYYKGIQKRTFLDKIKKADEDVKKIFNIVKNELLKYENITNKLTHSSDCFYAGRNLVAKISLTSKKVRIYLAVDPSKYPERQFPHKDVSGKKAHHKTPYYTLLKSQLSVKRINKVIADMMQELNRPVNKNYKPKDYATKYKFFKSDQK